MEARVCIGDRRHRRGRTVGGRHHARGAAVTLGKGPDGYNANQDQDGDVNFHSFLFLVPFSSHRMALRAWTANLFPEHFCDDENDEGSEKPSSRQQIDQGKTGGGEQGRD